MHRFFCQADFNYDGNVDGYDWITGPPEEEDVNFDNKKMHIVNFQSDYDMFTIGDFQWGGIYGGEITDYSVFPTWNHWPVGQMPSDGRYASFPDRTGHSSLTQLGLPTYKEDFGDMTKLVKANLLSKDLHDRFIEKYGTCRCYDLQTSFFTAPAPPRNGFMTYRRKTPLKSA